MRDKSLDIFLMVIFGVGGITILILAWAQPMHLTDRILSTFIGSIGVAWILIRTVLSKPVPAETAVEKIDSQDAAGEGVFVRRERR